LLPVRTELLESGEIAFKDSEDWNQVLEPQRDPDLSLFSEDEMYIANEVFEELRPFNAIGASDYSHLNSPGWNAANELEDIPYETARISTEKPPEEVFAFFRALHGVTA
jgi:hypothetical protein